jgi:hypothetical protein
MASIAGRYFFSKRYILGDFFKMVFKADSYCFAILIGQGKGYNQEFRDFAGDYGFRFCRYTQRSVKGLSSMTATQNLFIGYTFVLFGRNRAKFLQIFEDEQWLTEFSDEFMIIYMGYDSKHYFSLDEFYDALADPDDEVSIMADLEEMPEIEDELQESDKDDDPADGIARKRKAWRINKLSEKKPAVTVVPKVPLRSNLIYHIIAESRFMFITTFKDLFMGYCINYQSKHYNNSNTSNKYKLTTNANLFAIC